MGRDIKQIIEQWAGFYSGTENIRDNFRKKPILLNGAETRTWTKDDSSRLHAVAMRFLRGTEKNRKRDRIGNELIRERLKVIKLQETVKRTKIQWVELGEDGE